MVVNLLKLVGMNRPVPDFLTLCRQKTIGTIQIAFRRSDSNLNLLVDITGTKMHVDGEWQVRRQGSSRRRQ